MIVLASHMVAPVTGNYRCSGTRYLLTANSYHKILIWQHSVDKFARLSSGEKRIFG
jgi:hypothetical protein